MEVFIWYIFLSFFSFQTELTEEEKAAQERRAEEARVRDAERQRLAEESRIRREQLKKEREEEKKKKKEWDILLFVVFLLGILNGKARLLMIKLPANIDFFEFVCLIQAPLEDF